MTTQNENQQLQVAPKSETSMTLKQVTDRVNLVHQVLAKVMKKGTHYGTVPGCGTKMVLLKPGADVLAMTFRLVPQFAVSRTDLEGGHREYDVTCSMYGPDGTLLGQGVGSASTMEKKYRYRWEGEGKERHKIENEDIADVFNTVLKIAKKRAHIDATLTVSGAADLFTQDLIDDDEDGKRAPVAMPQETGKAATPPPAAKSDASPASIVTGVVEKVVVKSGDKNGKKWTRYGVTIGDTIYGTFDETVGQAASDLEGEEVNATVEQNGKYWNLLNVSKATSPAAEEPPRTREPGDDDELPFMGKGDK